MKINDKMYMNRLLKCFTLVFIALSMSVDAYSQFDFKKALGGASKAVQAITLTDGQVRNYVKEYIDTMDLQNKVCADTSAYAIRLKKLTQGLDEVDGIPLNFKVYEVTDVNAFACADGSVRVFSALMDIMTDDELLGVIGHEIGHVALRHSRNSFKTALLTSALKDGLASNGGAMAKLTESQIGKVTESLINSRYSRKQETEADDYGYAFLKQKGKNPWAMSLSFRKLKSLQEDAGANNINIINQLFSTHPNLDSRIKRMERQAKSDGFEMPKQ